MPFPFFSKPARPQGIVQLGVATPVANTKTVAQVLGESFNYETGFQCHSAFAKKLLKFMCNESNVESAVFLLMVNKFEKTPSWELFETIYQDFIKKSVVSAMEGKSATLYPLNIRDIEINDIERIRNDYLFRTTGVNADTDPPPPAPNAFDKAQDFVLKATRKDNIFRLPRTQYHAAFTLNSMGNIFFNDAIRYLQRHMIHLM